VCRGHLAARRAARRRSPGRARREPTRQALARGVGIECRRRSSGSRRRCIERLREDYPAHALAPCPVPALKERRDVPDPTRPSVPAARPTAPLRIDTVSGIVCPWCTIGYRQLALALERTGAPRRGARIREDERQWHPHNPHHPVELSEQAAVAGRPVRGLPCAGSALASSTWWKSPRRSSSVMSGRFHRYGVPAPAQRRGRRGFGMSGVRCRPFPEGCPSIPCLSHRPSTPSAIPMPKARGRRTPRRGSEERLRNVPAARARATEYRW